MIFQENTGEETTGIAGAVNAGKEATEETRDLLDSLYQLYWSAVDYVTSAEFIGKLLASAFIILIGLFVYRIVTHGVPRILRWRRGREEILDAEAVARIKRQDTAITLLRNALRYVTFAVVALLVISIFLEDPLPAAAGATLVAAVVGFGAQSFLRDIIAGFSIVFEGQFAVGDFIEVEPFKASGIVEEFGLRTTKLRSLSGEIIFVPNGVMMGVRNYVSGQERFNVEVQVKDAEAAERVAGALKESSELYLIPPRLAKREELDGRTRLRIIASVLPTMSWLVEENLTERLKAAAGEESLAAEPLVYKVDQANLRRIRDLLPQEAEKKLDS
jgi:small-conductance mechanosensitive channel